jgi:hypothetical protein
VHPDLEFDSVELICKAFLPLTKKTDVSDEWAYKLADFQYFLAPEFLAARLHHAKLVSRTGEAMGSLEGTVDERLTSLAGVLSVVDQHKAWIWIAHSQICYHAFEVYAAK